MEIFKKIFLGLSGLIVFLGIAVGIGWFNEIRTISSVTQVDGDAYLYEMDYKANYDLDEIIENDIDENARLLEFVIGKLSKGLYKPHIEQAGNDFACTSFQAAKAEGSSFWFGRNYDFYKNPTLVVHCNPRKGYKSLSVCDMSHFGYSLEKLPDTFIKSASCIAGIYAPMDGINEKGLCVSIMALPHQASRQNEPGKHAVGTTIIMRLILDRCENVEEAIALVNTLNVRHDTKGSGAGYHYMVADAAGDCCVIEFDKDDNWKTLVVRKPDGASCMHVTNHLLNPKHFTTVPDEKVGNPHSRSWWRYETVDAYLKERGGKLTEEEARECLAKVHWKDLVWDNGVVEDTQYSCIYDQENPGLTLYPWNDYGTAYSFDL